jgi:DNA-binding NtrC family response regulator
MQIASVASIDEKPTASGPRMRTEEQVIARSSAMRKILGLVRKISRSNVPVLIQGEIGTGKQTLAREIHRQSPRSAGPLVHVVCGSLRESDLEEKLFGQSWDCSRRSMGEPASLQEPSRSGTLFLDGVAQLPFWAQVKLLGALQHSNGRSGEDGVASGAEARVIVSSTCDLQTAMLEDRFFSGLYYYLNAVRIDVPPLRQRQEDIRALAEHFLAGVAFPLCGAPDKIPRRFSAEGWQFLLQYDWPGNVLQLAAVVARAAMLAEGPEIGHACFAGLLGGACQHADSETIPVPLAGGLKHMELVLVNEVIRRCMGNKAAAARALRLHRRTLYRLLEEAP